jgi:flagellin-like protein
LRKTREAERKKRGVSPIIATILLVAITVVLAAVLYILVSTVIPPTGGGPIEIGFGTEAPSTCTTAAGATLNTYVLPIASATSGLTTAKFGFKIENLSNAPVPPGTASAGTGTCPALGSSGVAGGWVAVLQSDTGTNQAMFDTNAWAAIAGSTLPLAIGASQDLVVVSTHPLAGDTLQVYGTSSTQSVSGQGSL